MPRIGLSRNRNTDTREVNNPDQTNAMAPAIETAPKPALASSAMPTYDTEVFALCYALRVQVIIKAMADDKQAPARDFLNKHHITYGDAQPGEKSLRRAKIDDNWGCLSNDWWSRTRDGSRDDLGWLTIFEQGANTLRLGTLPDHNTIAFPTAPVIVAPPDWNDMWQAFLADGAREKCNWAMCSTLEPYEEDPQVFGCTLADNRMHVFLEDTLIRNELLCILFLLHRQLQCCPPDVELTPGARFSVCCSVQHVHISS